MARRLTAPRPQVLAFLQDIKQNPDDDVPRLIFADWLDDHGEAARAEFVRLQVEIARGGDTREGELARREQELRREHESAWLGPLRLLVENRTWRRGLLHMAMTATRFRSQPTRTASQSEAWAWVYGATLRNVSPKGAAWVAASPLLADLNTLHIGGNETFAISPGGAEALSASRHVRYLTRLLLVQQGLVWTDVTWLATSPHLQQLTELVLNSNRFSDTGVFALTRPDRLTRLTTLELAACSVTADGARWLADAPNLARLTTLNLYHNHLGDAGVAALTASPHLTGLRRLELAQNSITAKGAALLANSPAMAGLHYLSLSGNPLGHESAPILAASPFLKELRELRVAGCQFTDQGVGALFDPQKFPKLKSLYVSLRDVGHRNRQQMRNENGCELVVEKFY
jgi:uncharacterized protein (TIGR02996 family)